MKENFMIYIFWTILSPLNHDAVEMLKIIIHVFPEQTSDLMVSFFKIRFYSKLLKKENLHELKSQLKLVSNYIESFDFLYKITKRSLLELKNEIREIKTIIPSSYKKIVSEELNIYYDSCLKPLLNELNILHTEFYKKIESLKLVYILIKEDGDGMFSQKIISDLEKNTEKENVIAKIEELNIHLSIFPETEEIIVSNQLLIDKIKKEDISDCLDILRNRFDIEKEISKKIKKRTDINVLRENLRNGIKNEIIKYESEIKKIESDVDKKEKFIDRVEKGDMSIDKNEIESSHQEMDTDLKKELLDIRRSQLNTVSKIKCKKTEIKRLKCKINELEKKGEDVFETKELLNKNLAEKESLYNELNEKKKNDMVIRLELRKIKKLKVADKKNEQLECLSRIEKKVSETPIKTTDPIDEDKLFDNLNREKMKFKSAKNTLVNNVTGFFNESSANKSKKTFFENLKGNLHSSKLSEITRLFEYKKNDNLYTLYNSHDIKTYIRFLCDTSGDFAKKTVLSVDADTKIRFIRSDETFGEKYGPYDKIFDIGLSSKDVFCNIKPFFDDNFVLISFYYFDNDLIDITSKYLYSLYTNVELRLFKKLDDHFYNFDDNDKNIYNSSESIPASFYNKNQKWDLEYSAGINIYIQFRFFTGIKFSTIIFCISDSKNLINDVVKYNPRQILLLYYIRAYYGDNKLQQEKEILNILKQI